MRYNPFNPQMPARPQIFVGREPEIEEFERYLAQTMHGSPMNMSINGNRGMGKTSLLVKFEEIAKKENCLVLRMSNYEGNVEDVTELADYISTNLKRELLFRKPLGPEFDRLKQYAASIKPIIGYGDVSLSVEKEHVVQDQLRIRLTKLWDEMKGDFPAVVILIDEAESLEKIEGALIFLREVFQRTSADANYMVVLAGKLNFPERMSESFSPLNRFFPCSTLAPLGPDAIRAYVECQLGSVGVSIDDEALDHIAVKSEGHPYVLVAMCYMIFEAIGDNKQISLRNIQQLEDVIIERLAQDFFKPMYHPLSPGAKKVLSQIAQKAQSQPFVFSDAVKWMHLSSNRVSPYIHELMRKGIINKLERGKYQLFHGLFSDYINTIEIEK